MSEQWVGGIHAVKALLANPHRQIKKLYVSVSRHDERLQAVLNQAQTQGVPLEMLSSDRMNQQFGSLVHQGIVAVATAMPEYTEHDIVNLLAAVEGSALVLILDGITDPHNLGACLRSADAAGVDFVVIPKDKSATVTPVVSKVASGAAESVPLVRATNLARAMTILKEAGVWLYGAAGETKQSIYDLELKSAVGIVMGAEGDGLRRLTREHCDGLFALPMLGSVESLNVSVAAGISLYEVVRQRQSTSSEVL